MSIRKIVDHDRILINKNEQDRNAVKKDKKIDGDNQYIEWISNNDRDRLIFKPKFRLFPQLSSSKSMVAELCGGLCVANCGSDCQCRAGLCGCKGSHSRAA